MPSRSVIPTLPRDLRPGDVVLIRGDHTVREVVKLPVRWRSGRMVQAVKYKIFLHDVPGYVMYAPQSRVGRVEHYCRCCGEHVELAGEKWEADGLIGRENYESKAKRLYCDKSEDHFHV